MTTELEQKFYDTFGIEPFCNLPCNKRGVECTDNTYCGNNYPDITAEKLLEMICILGTVIKHFKIPPKLKLEQLKYYILRNCINEQEGIYTRIQQLFKD